MVTETKICKFKDFCEKLVLHLDFKPRPRYARTLLKNFRNSIVTIFLTWPTQVVLRGTFSITNEACNAHLKGLFSDTKLKKNKLICKERNGQTKSYFRFRTCLKSEALYAQVHPLRILTLWVDCAVAAEPVCACVSL